MGTAAYHQLLGTKNYEYRKPGIGKSFWNTNVNCMEFIGPFSKQVEFYRAIHPGQVTIIGDKVFANSKCRKNDYQLSMDIKGQWVVDRIIL